jgi:hypothetical protein
MLMAILFIIIILKIDLLENVVYYIKLAIKNCKNQRIPRLSFENFWLDRA